LLVAGHEVVVWNRDAAKAMPLLEAGAAAAESPADAARGTEAVITMVSDPGALKEVTEGPEGVAAGASPATTVIQMSTVGTQAIARLASALSDPELLDAPVLGSVSEAENGTLKIYAGGSEGLVDR